MEIELIAGEKFDLVILDDEGCWQTLMSSVTYEDADHRIDTYTDQHPHAILDIIPHAEHEPS